MKKGTRVSLRNSERSAVRAGRSDLHQSKDWALHWCSKSRQRLYRFFIETESLERSQPACHSFDRFKTERQARTPVPRRFTTVQLQFIRPPDVTSVVVGTTILQPSSVGPDPNFLDMPIYFYIGRLLFFISQIVDFQEHVSVFC